MAPQSGGTVADSLAQQITIPANTTHLVVTGVYHVFTTEQPTTLEYDTAALTITEAGVQNAVPLTALGVSNLTKTTTWTSFGHAVARGFARVQCPSCQFEITVPPSMCHGARRRYIWRGKRTDRAAACSRRVRAHGIARGHAGSVGVPQRFGSFGNANWHAHVVIPDGVFTEADDGRVDFHRLPPLTDDDVATLAARIVRRTARILARRDAAACDDEPPDVLAHAQADAVQVPLALPVDEREPGTPSQRALCALFTAWSPAHAVSPRRWRAEVARPPHSVLVCPPTATTTRLRSLGRWSAIASSPAAALRGARTALLRLAASKEVSWPDGRGVHVTVRTLQRWLARFTRGGLAALARKPRKDKGRVRAISEAALARVIPLRKEEPARSTPTLIDIVERADEIAKGALCRSTLDRHLDRRGASRRMMHVLGAKRHVELAFPRPLDFVVGDFHQGPYYRDVHGEIRRAVLGAFIDHCSRYVPESRYGTAEDQMHVRRALRALCTTVGPPHKVYVDGGPGYQGARFELGCSQLGIEVALGPGPHGRRAQDRGSASAYRHACRRMLK